MQQEKALEVKGGKTRSNFLKKFFKFLGFFILFLVGIVVFVLIQTHYEIKRGDLVKWDNQWYTREELLEKYPSWNTPEPDVPAKNTPEQVYAEFRQALLSNDKEAAISHLTHKRKDGYREAFKNEKKFNDWIQKLPEKITQESEDGGVAEYHIDMGTEYKNIVSFIKEYDGYWKIDVI